MQAKLVRVGTYDVTREYYFKSVASGQEYRVYDESDTVLKSGDSLFSFMVSGNTYEIKLFMMVEATDKAETIYTYVDDETPGDESFGHLVNEFGDDFFVELDDVADLHYGQTVPMDNLRLDLMQVDDVLFGDYK